MQIITNENQKEVKEHGSCHFPFLVSMESLSRYDAGSFLWHWHPEIELTLITEGEMCYQINDMTYHMHSGEALFCNSSSLHSGYRLFNEDCNYISITFDPKLLYGNETSTIYLTYIKPIQQNANLASIYFDGSSDWHNEIITLIHKLIETNDSKHPTYEMDILRTLTKLWQLIYLHTDSQSQVTEYDNRNYERIRTILSYIEAHYHEKITLEMIAHEISLCKGECCRLFKKHMNTSLFEFLLQYRIEKSLDYLFNSNYSISEIASLVGFNDSNYFTKVFRQQKGCSPSKFRRTQ